MKNLSISALVAAFGCASAFAAVEIPADLSSCTNFSKCHVTVRNGFRTHFTNAAKQEDAAKFAALADLLAKSPVDAPTYDLWEAGARALVDTALAQKKKKPEEQKAVMAGFREGGTTFGLWQGGAAEAKTPDQAYVAAAKNLLSRKMPQKDLPLEVRARRVRTYLDIENRVGGERSRREAADALKAFAYAEKPVTTFETNAVLGVAAAYHAYLLENEKYAPSADFALDFRTKRADLMSASEKAKWFGREIAGRNRADDEKTYLKLRDEYLKLPVDAAYFDGLVAFKDAVTRRHPARWTPVKDLAAPLRSARTRVFRGNKLLQVDEFLMLLGSGLHDVALLKEVLAEMNRVQADLEKAWNAENARGKAARNPEVERPQPWSVGNARRVFCREMTAALEWAALVPELEKQVDPRNPAVQLDLMKACILSGGAARALELAAALATNTVAKADQKFAAAAYAAYLKATDAKSLRANLAALRGDLDDRAWFNALRRAGRLYFNLDPSEKKTDWLKEVIAMSREMLWPEEHVEYALTWLEDAPRSAEAAYRMDLFGKLKTENRLGLYNCYSLFDKPNEEKLLKSNPAPHLAADVPGKEACVAAAYDAWGLHVYMRFNDPEAVKAKDGIANGFYCEYDFQPGGETPWHWNMVTRADSANTDQGAVWDSPRKGFKVGAEYVTEDVFSAADCHVFHVYVPWILCWNEFPKNGDVWRLVVVAGWAGQFGALGGGAVHELGRSLHLKFDLPDAARAKMTKKLLREAVRDYHRVRDHWENASFWADADLGDPAFHEAVVKPFLESCDALAKECSADDLADARAAEILATRLGDLADFRLALDRKRVEYLRSAFFAK